MWAVICEQLYVSGYMWVVIYEQLYVSGNIWAVICERLYVSTKLHSCRCLEDPLHSSSSNGSIYKKNASHIAYTLDNYTKPMTLYSSSSLRSSKPNCISLYCHYWQNFIIWLCYLFFSWLTLPAMCVNSIAKWTTFSNKGVRNVEFDLLDCGEDGEHNSVGFVYISKIFPTYQALICGTEQSGRVYPLCASVPQKEYVTVE